MNAFSFKKPAILVIVIFLVLSVVERKAIGQLGGEPPKVGEGEDHKISSSGDRSRPGEYIWTETQWQLTYGIVGFAGVVIIGQFAVMFMSKTFWTDRQFQAFTLTLLLTSGLILIVAGFTDSQIAPMMGLIGTIAGYVLGSARKDEKDSQSDNHVD